MANPLKTLSPPSACAPSRPTYGPARSYLLSHPGGRNVMSDCNPSKLPEVSVFFGMFTLVWAVTGLALAVAMRNKVRQPCRAISRGPRKRGVSRMNISFDRLN